MHVETATFERVFDLHRWRTRRGPVTVFSFRADGQTRYSVSVEGWPELSPGTTVTAALRREGNWQTLIGWRNHSTGELAIRSYRRDFASAGVVCLLLLALGAYLFGAASPSERPVAGVLVFVFLGLLSLTLSLQGLVSLRAQRLLMRASIPPSAGANAA